MLTLVVLLAGVGILVLMSRSPASRATGVDPDPPVAEGAAPARSLRPLPAVVEPSPSPPAEAPVQAVVPTHAAGPKCESCSLENCVKETDGCDRIADPADRKLCEELYACFSDPANNCINQGDPVKCWCGTHPTTCLTDKDGPNRANGPCAAKIFAGARTNDPATIRDRFVDPAFPLGSAVNLTLCRGSWCATECKVQ